jgi:hypothetical protein
MWNVLFDMNRPERGLAVSDVRGSQNFSRDLQDPCRSMPGNRNPNIGLGHGAEVHLSHEDLRLSANGNQVV